MEATGTTRIDSMEPNKTELKIRKGYPLEFFYVKTTFLEKQYRQCIATCRHILETEHEDQARHPLEQTFMRLYLALSHDELARSMHNFSSIKLSAFTQAESLYREAAAAIPTVERCHELLEQRNSGLEEVSPPVIVPLPQSESQSTLNSEVFRRAPSPSPFLSPPTQAYKDGSVTTSTDGSDSESENDLESHDSFDEMQSAQGIPRLPSTFSSMSLLDPQKQARGLLRPVRPGSIAKPYQAPPKFSPSPKQYRSRLPRLNTGSSLASPRDTPPRQSSPVRKQLRSSDEEWSPVGAPTSPVSSLGSDHVESDDGAVSPLSPSTLVTPKADLYFPRPPEDVNCTTDASGPLFAHVAALGTQIDAHILLLQQERERTIAAQADRAARNNMRKIPPAKTGTAANGLPQSRSFWLFTPQDMKVLGKQKRIEEGRQRMWVRPVFDPTRYQGLAESALAEL